MGICYVSMTLPLISVTKTFVVCTGVFVFYPSTLIKLLNDSHSLSNWVLMDGCCTLRGGRFNCGVVEFYCCESSFDWAVSFTEPSLLSLSYFLERSEVSLPDFDLELSVSELPLRLTQGVGSLMSSKRKLSKAIVVNLLSLYILNSWNSSGENRVWANYKIYLNEHFSWNISSKRSSSPENTLTLTAVVKSLTTSYGSNSLLGNLNNFKHVIFFTSLNAWPTSNNDNPPQETWNCRQMAFFLSFNYFVKPPSPQVWYAISQAMSLSETYKGKTWGEAKLPKTLT